MEMQLQLQQRFQHLEEKELEMALLYIEFLIQRRPKAAARPRKKARKRTFLADLETIPIQVDHLIINREDIYADDRF